MPGIMSNTLVLFFLSLFINHVASLGLTDTITWGGDNSRTGYQEYIHFLFFETMEVVLITMTAIINKNLQK